MLVAASDLNLEPLRILNSSELDEGGGIVGTQYNPIAIIGLSLSLLLGISIIGCGIAGLVRVLGMILPAAGACPSRDAVLRTGRRLEQELGNVLGLIRAHIATNESYAKSLSSARARLANLSEAEQVRVIVSLLVAENERMRRDSEALKFHLEDSRKQIQVLRSSLSHAQEVVLKDPLTGTGNRRHFDMTMEKAIIECERDSTPLSVIMCDIDHFKRVNDAYGHQVGDELIRMFARVIQSNTRESDTVIRYGGEEFAVILPMTAQEAAHSLAERIRRQFEAKRLTIRETNQKIGQLTASFGVAEYRAGDDVEALVQRADAKLYDAKSSGRNRVASLGHSGQT
ncbi:diguanylate cyclase [Hyphomicrobium sp.]|uniref:diguanylate cyclase n=1 Tax=Hyphomicrobium sp. TaxID=82 RepID=UPI002FDE3579